MRLKEWIDSHVAIIDGAMGTEIQKQKIPTSAWAGKEGCNELLCHSMPEVILSIHKAYVKAGANIIKTNSFGTLPWVLDEYDISHMSYDLAKKSASLAKEATKNKDKNQLCFIAGALGPGTKLPSLGHIDFDTLYDGYKISARGLIDGGCDLFLLETAQDPLQIKAALLAIKDLQNELNLDLPIMVSVTIELSGTMLIGTGASTIATILEPFDVFSLGFNCGTGPAQVKKHVQSLSSVWNRAISVHANAGLPQNRGGYTFYPMGPIEFAKLQCEFLEYDGVSILGGCCGTTPQHILELSKAAKGIKPKKSNGVIVPSLASLYDSFPLVQTPAPFLIGERSNATGSKAFREILLNEDFEGTLSVAQEQVRSGAHGLDVSVGYAGLDELKNIKEVVSRYAQKIPLPLMVDSTSSKAIEVGLKCIGGRAIINSVNLEDGIGKFDEVCSLAKRFGAALVCLSIDEKGMAKTKEEKVNISKRICERATKVHNLREEDLVFDLLTFTVGSGDEAYRKAALYTIDAIRELSSIYPKVGFVLGVSNISFGLQKNAREYLNSVFLHHCVKAGLSMAIVNVKNTLPLHKISDEDRIVCENLLFDNHIDGKDPLFVFIDHFSNTVSLESNKNESFELLSNEEKIRQCLIDGDKERMSKVLPIAKDFIDPSKIINKILINAMKEVGELFGSGKMQLPFVLQSAEVMKSSVDYLNPFLPKIESKKTTTLIIGTVRGDVHDVGKNLVDIILSNNGFNVVNIGIKVELEDFLKTAKECNADAIGMSGLLVKSTAVMLENLTSMKEAGIKIPVILGGAALTQSFVDDYCRKAYDGPVFYCKDAFEGILAMSRIEKGDFNTDLGSKKLEEKIKKIKITKEINVEDIEVLEDSKDVLTPPFWGEKTLKLQDLELAFLWINHKILFAHRWGYAGKGLSQQEKKKQRDELLWPTFEKLKKEVLDNKIFEPRIIYGYFPCRRDGNKLYIFAKENGWFESEKAGCTPLDKALHVLDFPRQNKYPHRSISDFFTSSRDDVIAFSCVSSGSKWQEIEQKLHQGGDYVNYLHMHGLGVELAEALAEIAHKQVRLDLGIIQKEKASLRDVKMAGYTGCRYSFGYPACPELSDTKVIFDLLKPQRYGITLSETFQIHPEQSTTALIVSHEKARYFSI